MGTSGATTHAPTARDVERPAITFLFTDIEGSTRHVSEIGAECWHDVLEDHARILRAAIAANSGAEVRTVGDGFFATFADPTSAVVACVQAQRALFAHAWPHGCEVRVRMGLHTGEAIRAAPATGADFVGIEINRAARVAAVGHGGQVLLSAPIAALIERSLPADVVLRYLGEYRLKDLSRPERLYQLVIDGVPSDFPSLHSLDRVPIQLPVQITSFIGRERELASARRLLERSRLLTLIGPAGTGKTRLALQLAAEVAERFPDGVFFTDLSVISDPDLVATMIARAVRLELSGPRAPLEQVIDRIREKRLLLLLDNFEHLLSAAPQVTAMLAEAPSITVLATSRASLQVQGEQRYEVPPMALPADAAARASLRRSEAVRLFVDRALAVRPDLALDDDVLVAIGRICARLDGLPLAIELAAARVKVLPPEAILRGLADRLSFLSSGPEGVHRRHRTLRGTIAWSYELLDPSAKTLFERLGVFVGGAELPEIEAVCGRDADIGDALETITGLADHSLVRASVDGDAPRFHMLETIREFALERLAVSGVEPELRRRHAEVCLDLGERLAAGIFGPEHKAHLDRFQRDHENLGAALDHAVQTGDAPTAARLAVACWRYWQIRGHLREVAARTQRVLAVVDAVRWPDLRIKALEAAGGIAYWRGEMDAARENYHEQVAIARVVGDRKVLASALYNEVCANFDRPGPATRAIADECVALWRELEDASGIARSLWAAGVVRWGIEEFEGARRLLLEAVDAARGIGDDFQLGWALHMFGLTELRRAQPELAAVRRAFAEGLRIFAGAGDLSAVGLFLFDHSVLASFEGARDRAVRLAAASRAVSDRIGTKMASLLTGLDAVTEATLAGERERALWASGSRAPLEVAIAHALGELGDEAWPTA